MTNALVQVRIDNELKAQAIKVFSDVGLDLSTAIKIFLKRSVQKKGIPFAMNLDESSTISAIENIMSMRQDVQKTNTNFTLEDINAEILEVRRSRKK